MMAAHRLRPAAVAWCWLPSLSALVLLRALLEGVHAERSDASPKDNQPVLLQLKSTGSLASATATLPDSKPKAAPHRHSQHDVDQHHRSSAVGDIKHAAARHHHHAKMYRHGGTREPLNDLEYGFSKHAWPQDQKRDAHHGETFEEAVFGRRKHGNTRHAHQAKHLEEDAKPLDESGLLQSHSNAHHANRPDGVNEYGFHHSQSNAQNVLLQHSQHLSKRYQRLNASTSPHRHNRHTMHHLDRHSHGNAQHAHHLNDDGHVKVLPKNHFGNFDNWFHRWQRRIDDFKDNKVLGGLKNKAKKAIDASIHYTMLPAKGKVALNKMRQQVSDLRAASRKEHEKEARELSDAFTHAKGEDAPEAPESFPVPRPGGQHADHDEWRAPPSMQEVIEENEKLHKELGELKETHTKLNKRHEKMKGKHGIEETEADDQEEEPHKAEEGHTDEEGHKEETAVQDQKEKVEGEEDQVEDVEDKKEVTEANSESEGETTDQDGQKSEDDAPQEGTGDGAEKQESGEDEE